jgi:hypothetical protein
MDKLSSLLNNSSAFTGLPLRKLAQQAQSHQKLQTFWQSVVPKELASLTAAQALSTEKLIVIAYNPSAATKTKLLSARLLTQLQNLQKTNPNFKECKVTAIVVKMQVKSATYGAPKPKRKVPLRASHKLKQLADALGDSELAGKLKHLAENT